eukprot:CAMPEP_0116822464 /NCGR_PEP_ID=MMETSP0418-20121206/282_1 /TAXON_ID=1158023 /ORGANISM="Astrosyne radiata, Strain 13vi08-1A" /LENGTH=189 /DNA_ID=CAMNT_0004450579 /DNA_START=292 /DNA_END=858 /DNA_ORIENTATION=-
MKDIAPHLVIVIDDAFLGSCHGEWMSNGWGEKQTFVAKSSGRVLEIQKVTKGETGSTGREVTFSAVTKLDAKKSFSDCFIAVCCLAKRKQLLNEILISLKRSDSGVVGGECTFGSSVAVAGNTDCRQGHVHQSTHRNESLVVVAVNVKKLRQILSFSAISFILVYMTEHSVRPWDVFHSQIQIGVIVVV